MTIVQAPRAVSTTAPPRASRDTGVDFLRALCVLGVVLLHAIMVGVTVGKSGPVFDNARDSMIRLGAFAENTKPSGVSSRHFAYVAGFCVP